MMSATVIASGTARCTWFTATVMTVNTQQRRADHQVGADALLDFCRIGMHAFSTASSDRARYSRYRHREQEDPDQVDEVPVEARVLDPVRELLRVRLPQLRARARGDTAITTMPPRMCSPCRPVSVK